MPETKEGLCGRPMDVHNMSRNGFFEDGHCVRLLDVQQMDILKTSFVDVQYVHKLEVLVLESVDVHWTYRKGMSM